MVGQLLVIEDDVVHGAVVRVMAEIIGYKVTIATSIAQAVEQLYVGAFDCITLDLSLGGLSGLEALQALKVLDYDKPIIVISGAAGDQCDEAVALGKALNLNICQALSKPVEFPVLREMLVAILAQSQSEAPSPAALAV
jgi:CheY-like chemotaxis protein